MPRKPAPSRGGSTPKRKTSKPARASRGSSAAAKGAKRSTKARGSTRPTRLVLVRHAVIGETGSKLSGRTPGLDLSEEGRAQAKAVAERLAALPVAAVYASPLERTLQTAQAIAEPHDLDVIELPGVLEGDYGEWMGRKLSDLAKESHWKVVQSTPSRARFPGGETIREMQARVVAALEEVVDRHAGDVAVVVSHFDPIKAAVAHFLGVPLDLYQRMVVAPASVTALAFHDGAAPTLLTFNDTGTLSWIAPEPRKASR